MTSRHCYTAAASSMRQRMAWPGLAVTYVYVRLHMYDIYMRVTISTHNTQVYAIRYLCDCLDGSDADMAATAIVEAAIACNVA